MEPNGRDDKIPHTLYITIQDWANEQVGLMRQGGMGEEAEQAIRQFGDAGQLAWKLTKIEFDHGIGDIQMVHYHNQGEIRLSPSFHWENEALRITCATYEIVSASGTVAEAVLSPH